MRVLAVLLLACASPALADVSIATVGGSDQSRVYHAKVGAWMELEARTGEQRMITRYALVKKHARGFVLEMIAVSAMARVVYQYDYETDGKRWRIARTRSRVDGQAISDVPSSELVDGPPPRLVAEAERIVTPAGTFTCKHYRSGTGATASELWTNDAVLPFPMVKATVAGPVATTFTLLAYGTDARPSFD